MIRDRKEGKEGEKEKKEKKIVQRTSETKCESMTTVTHGPCSTGKGRDNLTASLGEQTEAKGQWYYAFFPWHPYPAPLMYYYCYISMHECSIAPLLSFASLSSSFLCIARCLLTFSSYPRQPIIMPRRRAFSFLSYTLLLSSSSTSPPNHSPFVRTLNLRSFTLLSLCLGSLPPPLLLLSFIHHPSSHSLAPDIPLSLALSSTPTPFTTFHRFSFNVAHSQK